MTRLSLYRKKRNFSRTPEPTPDFSSSDVRRAVGKRRRQLPIFVIQKHAARRLHYDFRLEAGGVLKSWAVPKGPSMNPRDRRLAVQTEDHPLDYANFEGTIPKGQYGGGTVEIWDKGFYLNLTTKRSRIVPVHRAVENGHVSVWMKGRKIKGGFALTRIGKDGERSWLLIKMTDAERR